MSNTPTTQVTNDPSTGHRLPQGDEEAPRLPRNWLMLLIAFLVGGGSGTGISNLVHGPGPDVAVTLTEISGKLDRITDRLNDYKDKIDDHEDRIRSLEDVIKKKGGK